MEDTDGNTADGNTTDPNTADPNATRRILALAVPTFGQLIAEPTFILIDTAIVGHIGETALAGLSIGSTIILTAVGLCIFLAYATTAQVAHLLGAGRRREGLQTGIDGLWLALGIGVALAIGLFLAAEPLCLMLGGRGEVLAQATAYTRAIVLGAPGMLLVYAANGIFRGLQKVRITLIAAVGGAILNTALDVLFVIVLRWGIAGSGVATLMAQWFMGLFLAVPAIWWARADGVTLRPRPAGLMQVGGDGLPLFIRTLAIRMAMVATVACAARMGTSVLAGFQAVNSTWNFATNMLDSVGIAGQTLVGSALGARDYGRARTQVKSTARMGLVIGVAAGAGFALVGLFAGRAFSPDPEVQLLVAAGMLTMGVFFPMQGWMMALDGILIGARDYRYLAVTCMVTTVAYVALLAAAGVWVMSWPSGATSGLATGAAGTSATSLDWTFPPQGRLAVDTARTVVIWTVFNAGFMGGRALANGLRARGEAWMRR